MAFTDVRNSTDFFLHVMQSSWLLQTTWLSTRCQRFIAMFGKQASRHPRVNAVAGNITTVQKHTFFVKISPDGRFSELWKRVWYVAAQMTCHTAVLFAWGRGKRRQRCSLFISWLSNGLQWLRLGIVAKVMALKRKNVICNLVKSSHTWFNKFADGCFIFQMRCFCSVLLLVVFILPTRNVFCTVG